MTRTLAILLNVLIYVGLSTSSLASTSDTLFDSASAQKPLWEVGAFAGGFYSAEYPASDQQHLNGIAAPYVIYRGDIFRIGDGAAARAVALDKDWLELDVSLDGSFNADSQDNVARRGMPDLDYLFEFGPQLKMRLKEFAADDGQQASLSLNVQARSVFSTDFSSFTQRGYVFNPELVYRHSGIWGEGSAFTLSLSPLWATEKLHDYFYQVSPEFVNDERSLFDARGGYLATELSAGLSYRATENIRLFVFAKLSLHQGAQNQQSPLFIKDTTYAAGLGISWRFFKSQQLANH